MTIKELSQLFYLNKEIDLCKKQLAELEVQRGVSAQAMDGMPHAKGATKSQVEQLAAEIVDLKAIIHAKQIESIHERNRLERYIAGIDNAGTRLIFKLRFVEGLDWEQVASVVSDGGKDRTVYAVKKRCYRYLDENS